MRIFIAALTCLAAATTASATDFVVTTTTDSAAACTPLDCSLRAAIIAANANPGPDKIILGTAQTYKLTLGPADSPFALTPATGDLDITDSLTIVGNDSVIDGNNLDRVLDISGSITVVLQDLTITGGLAQGFLSHGAGIQIRNASVTLDNVSVLNNQVAIESDARDAGGGIAVIGSYDPVGAVTTLAFLTANYGTIKSNVAGHGGGDPCGLWPLSPNNTPLATKHAHNDRGGAAGLGNASSTSMTSSLLVSNTAPVHGGGVAVPFGKSGHTWTRSTFWANQSTTGRAAFNNVASISAINNWWGCNYGPGGSGTGCLMTANDVVGSATTSPYLVAHGSAAPAQFAVSGSSAVTVDTTVNSANVDTSAGGTLSPRTGATFSTTLGTFS